ncbi:MAG: nitrite reductase small subunit NirD [Burkholderiales bacterium]|nr:nitrite reductase small subunit NirD [Burkholderiales bacterium]
MQQWIDICALDDIRPLGSRVVDRGPHVAVALFRSGEGKVFALLDQCPHKRGPLSQGLVVGEQVACPLHNWHIGLENGCATAPDEGCTPRFSVRLDGGRVYLDQDELKNYALHPKWQVEPEKYVTQFVLYPAI